MKTIEPVKVWYNGQEVDATVLNATSWNDNLVDSASFNYQLSAPGTGVYPMTMTTILVNGSLNMTGEVYQNWTTNDYAYDWIAEQLNLTITGNYNPPVPNPTPVVNAE
jgi:hypothetical protein